MARPGPGIGAGRAISISLPPATVHRRHLIYLSRLLVELLRDLEHFLRRVVRRESRRFADELLELAAVRHPLDNLELAGGIIRQRHFAIAPDAGDLAIVVGAKGV